MTWLMQCDICGYTEEPQLKKDPPDHFKAVMPHYLCQPCFELWATKRFLSLNKRHQKWPSSHLVGPEDINVQPPPLPPEIDKFIKEQTKPIEDNPQG